MRVPSGEIAGYCACSPPVSVPRRRTWLWDARSLARIAVLPGVRPRFSPDSRLLLTTNGDSSRNLFDAATGGRLHRVGGWTELSAAGPVECEPIWKDRALEVRIGEEPPRRVPLEPGRWFGAALSPDATAVLVCTDDGRRTNPDLGIGTVQLIDLASGARRWAWNTPFECATGALARFRGPVVHYLWSTGRQHSILRASDGALLCRIPMAPRAFYTSVDDWLDVSATGRIAYATPERLVVCEPDRVDAPRFVVEGAFAPPVGIAPSGIVAASTRDDFRIFDPDGREIDRVAARFYFGIAIHDALLAATTPDELGCGACPEQCADPSHAVQSDDTRASCAETSGPHSIAGISRRAAVRSSRPSRLVTIALSIEWWMARGEIVERSSNAAISRAFACGQPVCIAISRKLVRRLLIRHLDNAVGCQGLRQ